MKVLITGASGFVGRHVVRAVRAHGHEILALTRSRALGADPIEGIRSITGDLADMGHLQSAISDFAPEVVIHLAWQGIPDYSEAVSKTNLYNSLQLFDYIIEETPCRKLIAAGSCLEYGKITGVCSESDCGVSTSYIAWAKHALYRYLLLKCAERDIDLAWFRVFYVFGPGQRPGSLVPTLVDSYLNGVVPEIHSPLNRNDFIGVEDVTAVMAAAIECPAESGIYNLGSGVATSVYDMCKIVEGLIPDRAGYADEILQRGSNKETVNFWACVDKTARVFAWEPDKDLARVCERYIESLDRKEVH